jgi:hypothetical protein
MVTTMVKAITLVLDTWEAKYKMEEVQLNWKSHNIECHGPHNLWQQLQGGTTNVWTNENFSSHFDASFQESYFFSS